MVCLSERERERTDGRLSEFRFPTDFWAIFRICCNFHRRCRFLVSLSLSLCVLSIYRDGHCDVIFSGPLLQPRPEIAAISGVFCVQRGPAIAECMVLMLEKLLILSSLKRESIF